MNTGFSARIDRGIGGNQVSCELDGIDVVWEVQLLHPDFVDQELPGPTQWTASDWTTPDSAALNSPTHRTALRPTHSA